MVSAAEIEDRFRRLAAESLDRPFESVRGDLTFEEIGLDSLDVVRLVGMLEGDLDVELAMELLHEGQTIAEFAAAAETFIGQQTAAGS